MRRVRYFVVTALVLGACGSDESDDRGELERDLTRTVEEQTGTRDVEVTCPEEGDVCTVTAPGGVRAKVTVDGELVQP